MCLSSVMRENERKIQQRRERERETESVFVCVFKGGKMNDKYEKESK